MIPTTPIRVLLTLLGAMLLGGCAASQQTPAEEPFFPTEPSTVCDIMHAQAACGARHDATFRDIHFDGPALNALGLQKVELIAYGAAGRGLTVYLDLPAADPHAAARKADLERSLNELLAGGGRFTIVAGANPATFHPARPPKIDAADAPAAEDAGVKTPSRGSAARGG